MSQDFPFSRQIALEVEAAKTRLAGIAPVCAIFGSARSSMDSSSCQDARLLARRLSERGVHVLTGGGPGVMQAANLGAQEGRVSLSIGLTIDLDRREAPNPHQDITVAFRHFASRKIAFCSHSQAFCVFPGGFGTLDELFEALTLMQTGKTPSGPILLVGKDYWAPLLSWLREQALGAGCVGADDLARLEVMNAPEQALERVLAFFRKAP